MGNTEKPQQQEQKGSFLIGCVTIIILVLLVVGGCNALIGGEKDEPAPPTTPETTTSAKTTTAPVSNEDLTAWAKSVLGGNPGQTWAEIAAHDGVPDWAYAIQDVYYGHGNNVVFTMQIDRRQDKDVAEQVCKLYANSLRLGNEPWAEKVSYIIVENGAGEHVKQQRI